jgi:hypothetical protein
MVRETTEGVLPSVIAGSGRVGWVEIVTTPGMLTSATLAEATVLTRSGVTEDHEAI